MYFIFLVATITLITAIVLFSTVLILAGAYLYKNEFFKERILAFFVNRFRYIRS